MYFLRLFFHSYTFFHFLISLSQHRESFEKMLFTKKMDTKKLIQIVPSCLLFLSVSKYGRGFLMSQKIFLDVLNQVDINEWDKQYA